MRGVRLNLADQDNLRKVHALMMDSVRHARPDARIEGVLIEPMFRHRHGRELMIGVVRDPVFDVEDSAYAFIRFENGALGVIEASTAAFPGELKRIVLPNARICF